MELFDLGGRVAIVTGGNGGIGLAMARGMARAGARLVIAGRNEEKNARAAEEMATTGVELMTHVIDVTDEADCYEMVSATLSRFGRLDILVNNAGMSIRKPPEDLALAEWRQVLDTNLTAAFVCAQAAYEPMRDAGGGKIINIGSMMSLFGAPFAAPYASSKGGIVQMTKALATAWAKDNIQVNAVLPGWIDTELTVNARREVATLNQRVLDRTPAGRWGLPEDHEGVAVFLASRASDFVTGATIAVDGGYSANI